MVDVRWRDELYRARLADCDKLSCWAPGRYYHRGATLSGSRNTGDSHLECLTRANHGCPQPSLEATRGAPDD